MEGWLKLWRELANKPIWLNSSPEQKVILIALMMLANHEEKQWEWNGRQFKAEPGQFVTSIQSIMGVCGAGISSQNVRSALMRFRRFGFLTNESTPTGRLITITNWSYYQSSEANATRDREKAPKINIVTNIASHKPLPQHDTPETHLPHIASNIETNRQVTKGSQSTNKALTPTKNVRMKEGSIYTPSFESWWSSYPNQKGKLKAFECWQRLLKDHVTEDTLTLAETNYVNECKRRDASPDYIMRASTFLAFNHRPFADYLTTPERSETTCQTTGAAQALLQQTGPLVLPPRPSPN